MDRARDIARRVRLAHDAGAGFHLSDEEMTTLLDAAEQQKETKVGTYRLKPVRAAFHDGEKVGERLDDGSVRPGTCPDWFPSVTPVTHPDNTFMMPGEAARCGAELYVGGRDGGLRVPSGYWIVLHPDRRSFDVMSHDTFSTIYEAA